MYPGRSMPMNFFALSLALFAVATRAADRKDERLLKSGSSDNKIVIVDSLQTLVLKNSPKLLPMALYTHKLWEKEEIYAFFIGLDLGKLTSVPILCRFNDIVIYGIRLSTLKYELSNILLNLKDLNEKSTFDTDFDQLFNTELLFGELCNGNGNWKGMLKGK